MEKHGFPAYYFDGEIHQREGHSFDYSDPGESEQRLLEILRTASDLAPGSEELASEIHDWPSYYHLAPQRCDLFRPLEQFLSGDILEVGSGCGACSGFLAQHAGSLTALEGSPRRARLTAMRCRGFANVAVYCDRLQDFDPSLCFDVVTSIGVLEYANRYFDGPNGFDRMLRCLGDLLAPDGVLIIAIENRLGLKYFAGCPEDHVGQAFYGLHDLYEASSVLTLGRKELKRRIEGQGLEICTWLYPWPDYKSPNMIVSDAAFGEEKLDLGPWLRRHTRAYQDASLTRLFAEELVWPVVARNGLAQDLANSFVIVARRRGAHGEARLPGLLWEFQTGRRRSNATELRIVTEDEVLFVERRRLYPDVEPIPGIQLRAPARERLTPGSCYDEALFSVVNRRGWTIGAIAEWAAPWVGFLRDHGPSTRDVGLLPSAFVRREGAMQPWGVEMHSSEPVPFEFAVFHGFYDALAAAGSCAEPADASNMTLVHLAAACMKHLGLDSSAATMNAWIAREADMRQKLAGTPLEECRRAILQAALPIRRDLRTILPDEFQCQLFWRSGAEFSEGASRRTHGHLRPERQALSLEIPPLSPAPIELRLDLTNRCGVVRLHGIQLSGQSGRSSWTWDGGAATLQSAGRHDISFRAWGQTVAAEMYSDDPWVLLPIPEDTLQALDRGAVLVVELSWDDVFNYLRYITGDQV